MTPIVREAVRRVRESDDFLLLDCLELLDRRKQGEGALATMRWCGVTLLGYGDADALADGGEGDCPACEGHGELSADGADGHYYDVSCPKCDGDGVVEYTKGADIPAFEKLTWRDLNGVVQRITVIAWDVGPKFHDFRTAQTLVDAARKSLNAPKAVAA
jgi:hypothetical protein